MRLNPFMAARSAGKLQIGTYINTERNPAILNILQSAGLDYARIDMEHSSYSIESIADMALLSRALGFPIFIRPPANSREWITRLLDLGVWGLVCPGVNTPEIARSIVQAARYAPVGERGISVTGPHNDYSPETPRELMDEQVHITVMLESELAFSHLDDIVSMDGIDTITLGPNDLAHDLGILADPARDRVIDAYRQRLLDAAKRHGKDVSLVCRDPEMARHWIDQGVKIIVASQVKVVLAQAYSKIVSEVRRPE